MNNISKKIDSYIIALLLECFIIVSMLFMSYEANNQMITFIMLGITFFIIIITYISGMIVGLISTSICIFLYALYIFYNNLIFSTNINYITYVWMISLAIITLTTGKISSYIVRMQEINEKLQHEYHELVTIDKTTGLSNIKDFYTSLDKEISRAKRHNNELALMIIKFPYHKEVRNILGENKYNQLLKDLGMIIINSTRTEDDRYSLNDETMGVIMLDTPIDGAKVVKERIKERISKLNIELNQEKYQVNIDNKIAVL
ncbi:MAG: GGDEF domain-containing protein, partial [Peptostreptococcaceae bacterium]